MPRQKAERELFPVHEAHRSSCSQTFHLEAYLKLFASLILNPLSPKTCFLLGSSLTSTNVTVIYPVPQTRNYSHPRLLSFPHPLRYWWFCLFTSPVYPSLLLPRASHHLSPRVPQQPPSSTSCTLALYLSLQLTVMREPFRKYTPRLEKSLISQDYGLFLPFPTKSNQGSLGETTDRRCRDGNAQDGPRTPHDSKKKTFRFLGTVT